MGDAGHCGWVLCRSCFNVVLSRRGSPSGRAGSLLDIKRLEGEKKKRKEGGREGGRERNEGNHSCMKYLHVPSFSLS